MAIKDGLPAKVKRTGDRQLSVTLDEKSAVKLEAFRKEHGLRSWGAAIRRLIEDVEMMDRMLTELGS